MEKSIKQSEDEKRRAVYTAKRLNLDYKPLKDQINQLRESIGLKKTDENEEDLMKKIKSSLTHQVTGGKKGKPGLKEGQMDKRLAIVFLKYKDTTRKRR